MDAPDEKRNIVINEGADIIVELRDGERYRTYEYDVTYVRKNDADSKRAHAMWEDLQTLSSLVPRSTHTRRKRILGMRRSSTSTRCSS